MNFLTETCEEIFQSNKEVRNRCFRICQCVFESLWSYIFFGSYSFFSVLKKKFPFNLDSTKSTSLWKKCYNFFLRYSPNAWYNHHFFFNSSCFRLIVSNSIAPNENFHCDVTEIPTRILCSLMIFSDCKICARLLPIPHNYK